MTVPATHARRRSFGSFPPRPSDGEGTDDRIATVWGKRTPYAAGGQWPVRVDQHLGVAEEDVEHCRGADTAAESGHRRKAATAAGSVSR
jgi:hypothetical protein